MQTPTTTQAVAYLNNGPIDAPGSLVDVELEVPAPGPHDLLVEVRAVSVNPVDVKVRASSDPGGTPKVLGYDAAGVVVAVGSQVSAYRAGDEVYYAGSIGRPGTNSIHHLVDERIVGRKPRTLDFAEAAALPLTSITAWEVLFDRLGLDSGSAGTLLVVGAAGGVGSMILQLAHRLPGVRVIAAASRPESVQWVRGLGADEVVDSRDFVDEVKRLAPDGVDWVFSAFSDGNAEKFAEVLKVRGEVVAIDDPVGLDLMPLKAKSQTWHWELMFTRPLFEPESAYQRELLDEVARLVDDGAVRTTLTRKLSPLNAASLREAHRAVETSATIGKIVVAG
ncbi:zinc-binding alcohol dehydrogenase family protein [Motilibacter aurantiacus]|uniref:zinc-binding alcohol dehydrogenase family protein n=1 Tax=Motilibacter aurantiacus TaxID=2714955 RepID=UPI00140D423F|nr:zinc-binding alcohol dehydrogenase family protein [Motilibacter aurantiacus]NHC46816.1 zinc-binding alcohol dehydrogenase family protein [Motilibacter aurantiacus]